MTTDMKLTSSEKEIKPVEETNHQWKDKTTSNGEISSTGLDWMGILMLLVGVIVTIVTCPSDWSTNSPVTIYHVWFNGWLTAVATGLGVVPFFFVSNPSPRYIAIANGIAGGMMVAATCSLVIEGSSFDVAPFGILGQFPFFDGVCHALVRTSFGFLFGWVFIWLMAKTLESFEEAEENEENNSSTQSSSSMSSSTREVLMLVVMTLHSLTEGVGIGVSFGGESGRRLGHFISASLALHNVPEGLAVGLVQSGTKKTSTLRSVLWAIFTSLPQPIFAVPAYLFVERFAPMLPGGLGFAAGAMAYVAFFELLEESAEVIGWSSAFMTSAGSFAVMTAVQTSIKAYT